MIESYQIRLKNALVFRMFGEYTDDYPFPTEDLAPSAKVTGLGTLLFGCGLVYGIANKDVSEVVVAGFATYQFGRQTLAFALDARAINRALPIPDDPIYRG